MPRDIGGREYDGIRAVAAMALRALGLRSGFTHMEWFRRPDGSVAVSEVAARPPGAQITSMLCYVHDFDFYRAWAQAQPHVNRDRPEADRFGGYVGAFVGLRPAAARNRDTVPDVAKLCQAGVLLRHVRNAEGLRSILQQFFRMPVGIEQFVSDWMALAPGERTALGGDGATLGRGAVLGARVWDGQHKFRVHIGSLTLQEYESFLPGGTRLGKLVDWVTFYLSFELDWDVRLILKHDQVPPLTLNRTQRLGWTTWLGARRTSRDADDLCLHPDTVLAGAGVSV
jgi:type VI secretion system protein ImpH